MSKQLHAPIRWVRSEKTINGQQHVVFSLQCLASFEVELRSTDGNHSETKKVQDWVDVPVMDYKGDMVKESIWLKEPAWG